MVFFEELLELKFSGHIKIYEESRGELYLIPELRFG